MRAAPAKLLFLLAASLTFLISWGALAQEPTPTPEPTLTPTATETATLLPPLPPTEPPTATQTETPTIPPLPTPNETATASATSTETVTPLPLFTETATNTATASPMFDPLATLTETLTATMTGAASATASATGTGTLFPTLTLTPEPPLPLLLAEDFANPYQPDWDYAAPVTAFVDGGFLIRFYSNWAIRPRLTELTDAAIDVQVRLTNGTVMLFTHVSSVGAYRLTLTAQGQATLYRGATIMATATVSVPQSTWFDLRFSAIGGVLHGFLNGTEIITYTDTAPLPPGRLLLGARDLNGGNIQMDNVTLYGNVATAPASFQAEAMAVAPASGGDPVQPPPPNTVIVFDVDMGGSNREIFRINPDGTGRQQLTFNSAYDSDATLSPDGQKVAFVSNRDGNSNIYVMNIDGSNATPLTTHPADDYSPSWSPLGDRIAYVSTRSGELALYHIGSTQGDSVTPTPVLVGAQSPSWSPDGSQLAVSYPNPQNNSSDIYTVGKNGGVPTYRSGTAIANDHAPSWSPDGRWVAFASTVFSSVIGPNGESETTFTNDVLQIDLNNSSAVSSRYTAGFYDFMSPDWSPVGSQLVLQLGSGLHILPWSSSQPYRINDTYGTDGSPDWGIAAPLPATPTPTVLFSTPPPQSTSISETDYYEQFRGIAFWAIYNESNSNSQIPFSQVLPNSTPTISNTLALDHRYVMARVILNIIPLGDVRAGVNAMNRWGGSINETSYVLWQGVIPACQWQGSSIGTYSDARQAGATEVLRWMRGYAECHRTGNPLANARLGFDTAWNEIDAQITLAIQHKSQGNADPTSGAQYVKHTSSCFVWNRENNLVTSCRGNRGRIDMNAFCNERPNRPGDPTSPANRACTATGINPGNIDLSQWLVSSEGTSSNQQLGLDTTVGVGYQINLGVYIPDQPETSPGVYNSGQGCQNTCYFLMGNPANNANRQFTVSDELVANQTQRRQRAWQRHEERHSNSSYGYLPIGLTYFVHVLRIEVRNGQVVAETWITYAFQG